MATRRRKSKNKNDDLTKALNEIINQNLTIGVSTFGEDTSDFNDDHADMKSNASGNYRGSVSYSQPSSPKGNSSLSPVSSVSSLSDLSTENYDDGGSESCASLNSNDSSLSNYMEKHEFINPEDTIHEHKEDSNISPLSTDKHKVKSTLKVPNKRKKKKKKKKTLIKSISFETTTQKGKKPKRRRNSKDCLDITTIQRLTTESIQLWSVKDVIEWIKYIDNGKYREYATNFKSKRIDGKKLYKMNRAMLQSIEIYHPSARKAIFAALQKLKKKVRATSKKKINLYAKTHEYEKKKKDKRRKHKRGVSHFQGKKLSKFSGIKSEMYVVAVKKRKSVPVTVTDSNFMPPMPDHFSAPRITTGTGRRKYSQNVSEFLDEWEINSHHNDINFLNSNILEQTDNFTMIELENKRIVYAVTAKVEKWTNNDVCKWLNSISGGKFKKFIPKFKQRNTNGFDLLNISRVQLQNNIQMKDLEMRNILLREIKLLKIATKPRYEKLLKKRVSAISVKEMQMAQHKERGKHRKSASLLTGNGMSRSQSHSDLYNPPKKLGPRDIGRNKKYKGTKWERKLFDYDFLEEKLNYKVKTRYFNERKIKNPVQHKETVDEIGIVKDFEKPEYCNDVLRNMNRGGWLKDKPISRRNVFLDNLKGTKAPKNSLVSDIHGPIGWTPIKYEAKNDGKEFLEEHFWFDGSGVRFEFGFSRLLKCLPPNQLLTLNKIPSPSGYESKLNWLKMLLNMVTEEVELIKKEDALYKHHETEEETKENIQILPEDIITPKKEDNKSDIETEIVTVIMSKESEKSETEIIDNVSDNNEVKSDDNNNNNVSLPQSILSESDESNDENISSPNSVASPDMSTKRVMYKSNRNRAHTTLANSTLTGVSPMKRKGRKRGMSKHDMNRRRFLSQESVDSIQAIISKIERKRANGDKIEAVMD